MKSLENTRKAIERALKTTDVTAAKTAPFLLINSHQIDLSTAKSCTDRPALSIGFNIENPPLKTITTTAQFCKRNINSTDLENLSTMMANLEPQVQEFCNSQNTIKVPPATVAPFSPRSYHKIDPLKPNFSNNQLASSPIQNNKIASTSTTTNLPIAKMVPHLPTNHQKTNPSKAKPFPDQPGTNQPASGNLQKSHLTIPTTAQKRSKERK